MHTIRCLTLFLAAFCCTSTIGAVTIDTVHVGNPGNAADNTGYGAVSYGYSIGRTEVTNAQYTEFLNGVDPTGANSLALYSSRMSSYVFDYGGINFNGAAANGSKYTIKTGRNNNPVIHVSWYDSIRFANWLHNGQGSGDTENGAYTLLGGTPTPSNGGSIIRNAGAQWFLPSEDEWYKAAYHKNDGVTDNYWDYPTSTDAIPFSDQPPGSDAPTQSNTANFIEDDETANGYDDGYAVPGSTIFASGNLLTNVGAYTLSASPYSTFDQGGNVWEWNDTLISASFRGLRGGSWGGLSNSLHASARGSTSPSGEEINRGFRVATIPEPGALQLLALAGVGLLMRRKR